MAPALTFTAPKPQRILSVEQYRSWTTRVAAGEDMTAHLNAVFTKAVNEGYDAVYIAKPAGGQYINFSGVINIPVGISVLSDQQVILRDMSSVETDHVVVGSAGASNTLVKIQLHVVKNVFTTWAQANDCGILLHNPRYCELDLACEGFTNNICFRATGGFGVAYSLVRIGRVVGGRYNIIFDKTTSDAWSNQMTFDCSKSHISTPSGLRNTIGWVTGRYPVGILYKGTTNHPYNDHVWFRPSFEINSWEVVPFEDQACLQCETPCIDIEIFRARHENALPNFLRIKSTDCEGIKCSIANVKDATWQLADMYKSDVGQQFEGHQISTLRSEGYTRPTSYYSPNVAMRAKQYSAAGAIYVPGMFFDGGSRTRQSSATTHTINADSVQIADGTAEPLSMLIDTSKTRMLAFYPILDGTEGFARVVCVGWDAARTTRYAAAVSGEHYVQSNLFTSANFGGVYQAGANGAPETTVWLNSAVKWLQIGIWAVGGAVKFKGWKIVSLDNGPIQCRSWFDGDPERILVASQPSNGWKGNWIEGDIAYNFAPAAAGDPIGWRKRGTAFDAINP